MVTASRDAASSFDRTLLARTRLALDRWELETGVGPTSTLTGGGAIEAFEARFAAACHSAHALGLSSGTLALRTALQAVGVGTGASVVIPAFDWPAAAAAVASLGAHAVPADVAAGSFLVDPERIRGCLDGSTRAVVVTHLAGVPAPVHEVREICSRSGIPLIEDCCQALGAVAAGRPVGTIGDAGVFSLGPGKLLDACEGGVLITNDDSIYRAAVRATQHPLRQLRTGLDPEPLALSARLHPVAAIVALAGLEDLEDELASRRRRATALCATVRGVGGVDTPAEGPGDVFSWTCVPALADERAKAGLSSRGIGAEPLGAYAIPDLLCAPVRVPHARAAVRGFVRLYELSRSRGRDAVAAAT